MTGGPDCRPTPQAWAESRLSPCREQLVEAWMVDLGSSLGGTTIVLVQTNLRLAATGSQTYVRAYGDPVTVALWIVAAGAFLVGCSLLWDWHKRP